MPTSTKYQRSLRELRRHRRFSGSWRLYYDVEGRTYTTSVANLSLGGMFVRSARQLVTGETYRFHLYLDDDNELVLRGLVLARVKGNRGASHHARIQFAPGQGKELARLRHFLVNVVLPNLETQIRNTKRAPAKAAALAEIRAELGDWPEALSMYRRSLEANPTSQALHERAVVFFLTALESGGLDPRQALVEAEHALRLGRQIGASAILDVAAQEIAIARQKLTEDEQKTKSALEQTEADLRVAFSTLDDNRRAFRRGQRRLERRLRELKTSLNVAEKARQKIDRKRRQEEKRLQATISEHQEEKEHLRRKADERHRDFEEGLQDLSERARALEHERLKLAQAHEELQKHRRAQELRDKKLQDDRNRIQVQEAALDASRADLESQLRAAQEEREELHRQRLKWQDDLHDRQSELEVRMRAVQEEGEKIDRQRLELHDELEALDKERVELNNRRAEVQLLLEAEEGLQGLSERARALEQERLKLTQAHEELQKRRRDQELRDKKLKDDRNRIQVQEAALDASRADLESQLRAAQEEREELHRQRLKWQDDLHDRQSELDARMRAVQEEGEKIDRQRLELHDELEALDKERVELNNRRAEVQLLLEAMEKANQDLESKRTRADDELRAREAAVREQEIALREEKELLEQNWAMLVSQSQRMADEHVGTQGSPRGTPGLWVAIALVAIATLAGVGVWHQFDSNGSAFENGAADSWTSKPVSKANTEDFALQPERRSAHDQEEPEALALPPGSQSTPSEGDLGTSHSTRALAHESDSELRQPFQKHIVATKETLSLIALERYGSLDLWPLIYAKNASQLEDPDTLEVGAELLIPTLEGTASRLSSRDRQVVAAGFARVARHYQNVSKQRAAYYLRRAQRYFADPRAVIRAGKSPTSP